METLVLRRFNGTELYAVKTAILAAAERDGAVELALHLDTRAKPIQTLPDTAELRPRPLIELTIFLKTLDAAKLAGRRFSVPASYDEVRGRHVSRLYYCGHNPLNRNAVRVLDRQANRFLIRWTATAPDVNYYDGKPAARVEVTAWFTFKRIRKWDTGERTVAVRKAAGRLK